MTRPRIALADDHPQVREVVGRWLTALGCDVEAVADGAALVALCRAGAFDLVVSDVQMPGLDGLAAAAVLRGLGLPVVLMSGSWTAAEEETARAIGAAVLAKPVRPAELRAAVGEVLAAGASV